jgi:hypothetical protein
VDPVEAGERCPRKELIESEQTSRITGLFLTIDFLQAEDVGVDALQLRTHDTNALRQRRLLPGTSSRFSRLKVARRTLAVVVS